MYKTDRVMLAPVLSSDSERLFKWINDPEIVHYNGIYKPVNDITHAVWFESIGKDDRIRFFSIRFVDTNVLIGTCQLHSINFSHRHAELQIRIGEPDQMGKGYGTDSLMLLLKFGFLELGLNKIYLQVYAENVRAIRAYEKVGMVKEGLLRQHMFQAGKFRDVLIMSILENEFRSR